MNIVVLGGAGFIGTNLVKRLAREKENIVTVVDSKEDYFADIKSFCFSNVHTEVVEYGQAYWDSFVHEQDVVYHLLSTTIPTTSNVDIGSEIQDNVIGTVSLLDACVRQGVKRVVFISSGGTVYGRNVSCPINEDCLTDPINSYGFQKLMIEKLLHLYNCMYGLDYRVVRLANPYGPYQRPNGKLGVVTTFLYRAIHSQKIEVYGDGSVVRDYIYIDDAVKAIVNVAEMHRGEHIYNVGSGKGISILQLVGEIESVVGKKLDISFRPSRKVDVPVNYLSVSRYEKDCGPMNYTSLHDGIVKTIAFLKWKERF